MLGRVVGQFEIGWRIPALISPLQPAPITRILYDLHSGMQVFQSSAIFLDIQFECEMAISLALETAEKTTRRYGTPRGSFDRLSWPALDQRRTVPNLPFQVKQGPRAALVPRTRRTQITIKFVERHPPVYVEPEMVIMLPDRELLTMPNTLS